MTYMEAQNAATTEEVLPPAEDHLAETERKLAVATEYLRWLVIYTRGDWDLRRRTIAVLREMKLWEG